jgi:hypothetical protein
MIRATESEAIHISKVSYNLRGVLAPVKVGRFLAPGWPTVLEKECAMARKSLRQKRFC